MCPLGLKFTSCHCLLKLLAQVPLSKIFSSVFCVQVELDRFQATLQILKVYYLGMRGDVLPELSPDMLKVPLQEAVEIQDKYEKKTRSC